MIESVLVIGTAETASTLASSPPVQEFCLSGRAALALQIGHRSSKALDFFYITPTRGITGAATIRRLVEALHTSRMDTPAPGTNRIETQ